MQKRYSLSFTYEQLVSLADALEGYHTDQLESGEYQTHHKVTERVFRALSKANADQIADLVFN